MLSAASAIALASVTPSLAQTQDELAQPQSANPSADTTRFEVRAYEVKGNTLLTPGVVEASIYDFMGPGRTPDDVEAARASLQTAYERAGYPTVVVFIPEQSVANGVVRFEVAEQAIGTVTVEGATHTSAARLLAQAPSLQAGNVPNYADFERDIVALNNRSDRRVTPELVPGTAPGTVDIVLNVEDSLPIHGSLELNNRSSAATSDLRFSASLRHDDMFGRGDSLSVSVQTAPERTDDGTVYSLSYLSRLPNSRAQVLGYAVRSDSDISTVGGVGVVGRGDMVGLRLINPLAARGSLYQTVTLGVDYKNFEEGIALGADRDSVPIEYWPFMAQWRGDWLGDGRRSDLSVGAVWGVRGFGDDEDAFDYKRYQAQPNFFALRLDGSHTTTFESDLQIFAGFTSQWAGEPLISNEGFGLGGAENVRGYFESEYLGDYGFATQWELRSPSFAGALGGWMNELRVHGFADWGYAGAYEVLPGTAKDEYFYSLGLGLRLRAFDHLNLNLDIAQPLADGLDTPNDEPVVSFRLWGDF